VLSIDSLGSVADAYADWAQVAAALDADIATPEGGAALAEVELLASSLEPTALYFAGFNYRDHVANMMKVFNLPDDPDPKSIGLKPWHNLKPRNSLCGPGTTVKRPTPRVGELVVYPS
jgi:2-keto-4-pentenoate hydratase/2-oxohepta-3-ene-1,7-dioic acid hydratase in catechol pathway